MPVYRRFWLPLLLAGAIAGVAGCGSVSAPAPQVRNGMALPRPSASAPAPQPGGYTSAPATQEAAPFVRRQVANLNLPGGHVAVTAVAADRFEVSLERPKQQAVVQSIAVREPNLGKFTLTRRDLPGHAQALVVGQAPFWYAFDSGTLAPLDYAALTAAAAPGPGTQILVDKGKNILYLYKGGKLAKYYHVGTGRQVAGPAPTWNDYMTNYFTPEGRFTITTKYVNPTYTSSHDGRTWAGGDPDNPLGTRWMGFPVLQPDGKGHKDSGGIWALHGTNEPDKIGSYVSDGCIRMFVPDVEELFSQVPAGTPVTIVNSAR